ncbi:MAG: adenylate/guanylate cyclase domain-containing protein [Cyanobacteriota bacterium]|jgi:class 3 adenylate cyclase|nr:adenylate/guanylate cyclase domain-containing protein [Cyanobacteriota bacterium]
MEKLQDVGSSILEVIHGFNRAQRVPLSLCIGIHAGPLATGVMRGEQRLSFDIWGPTVTIARSIHPSPNRVQVSTPIMEALQGRYRFRSRPPITVRGFEEIAVWEIEPEGLISGAAPAAGAAATGWPPGDSSRELP